MDLFSLRIGLGGVNLFFLIYFFGCTGASLLLAAFSSVFLGRWGLLSSFGAQASHCSGFCYCRAQALGARASVGAAHGLSSCDSWALKLQASAVAALRVSSCGTLA